MSITQTQTQNQKLKTTLGELSYQIVEPILKKNQDLKAEVKRLKNKVNRMVKHHYELCATAQDEIKELRRWKDAFDDGTRFTCADCKCNCGRLQERGVEDFIELNYDGDEICGDCAFDIVMDKDEIQQKYFGVMEEMVKRMRWRVRY